jgi:hypothetical protein
MDYRFLSDRFYQMREQQIQQHRRTITSTDLKVSKIMLDASLVAMQNVQSGIRKTRVQAVPLGTGLGKSSSAYALIAAFYKADPNFTAAYVVPSIKMGIEAQESIEELLGEGSTTLWTSLHKHKGVDTDRAFERLGFVPTRLVDKLHLMMERIVIVTHEELKRALKSGGNEGTLKYMCKPRSIVFIDEHPDLLREVRTTPAAVQALHDQLIKHDPKHAWLPVLTAAVSVMSSTADADGQSYAPVALIPAEAAFKLEYSPVLPLWDMTDPEASDEVRRVQQDKLEQVVDFISAAAQGRAFYSRIDCQFTAYSLNLGTDYPGFVLLDATSAIAGLVTLNTDVRIVEVVNVDYERLQVRAMEMPSSFRNFKEVMKSAPKGREYGKYIRESVLANTEAGDDVLVVVHKDVLSLELIGEPSEEPEQPRDWEGRKVSTQNWGAGVGSNKFRDKTHVFMFGDFYLPRTATIAQTHGWSGKALTAEGLKAAEGHRCFGDTYAPGGLYRQVHDGHALRWLKQLAMRGTARSVDGDGKCKAMKLFLTMELRMLVPSMPALFPNAPMPCFAELPAYLATGPQQGRQALVQLAMQSKRAFISAEDITARTSIAPSKLSREYAALQETLLPLGWSLKSAADIGKAGRMKYLVNDAEFLRGVLHAA